jgi:peptidoglycan L-alanyl-D-glutamate endopeptidase CwlK
MTFRLSKSSLRNLDGVHPEMADVVKLAIQLTKVDFGIPLTGGYRTAETQNKLFLDGKSNADGYDKKSRHQSGQAVDVYAYVDGKASWEPEHLSMVACAMLEAAIRLDVNMRWGGHFKSFIDMPHFERLA